jgi:transposase
MAPGPPKAIGKGLFTNGFIAMLLTERHAVGRTVNSLVTGLARQGAEISPAALAGTWGQAGALLVPLADAIAERNRDSWHLHADETTWRVLAPEDGTGPQNWWLWGVHRPGHRLLRHGPVQVRARPGPPRRHRREDRAAGVGR